MVPLYDPDDFLVPMIIRLVWLKMGDRLMPEPRSINTQRSRLVTTMEPAPIHSADMIPPNWVLAVSDEAYRVANALVYEIDVRRVGRAIAVVDIGFRLAVNPNTYDICVVFFIEWNPH